MLRILPGTSQNIMIAACGLGPHIFAGYAADIARRVAARGPLRVLETAAGTGIVTRQLRDMLSSNATLLATDLNLPMLDVARKKFGPAERVEFRQADADALPFPDGAFDAAICQFGVMFFPDKDKAYREIFRVLAPCLLAADMFLAFGTGSATTRLHA
jgi:ubiquinone/menaquinone biosynthesis C-methylase UbiE